jgi:hypothetical protein
MTMLKKLVRVKQNSHTAPASCSNPVIMGKSDARSQAVVASALTILDDRTM